MKSNVGRQIMDLGILAWKLDVGSWLLGVESTPWRDRV